MNRNIIWPCAIIVSAVIMIIVVESNDKRHDHQRTAELLAYEPPPAVPYITLEKDWTAIEYDDTQFGYTAVLERTDGRLVFDGETMEWGRFDDTGRAQAYGWEMEDVIGVLWFTHPNRIGTPDIFFILRMNGDIRIYIGCEIGPCRHKRTLKPKSVQ